jgi:hypothetical protein
MTLTREQLKEALDYNPDTGLFTWKKLPKAAHRKKVGEIAGSHDEKGYIRIGINGTVYKSHRLAWLYVYGQWPSKIIDHVNGVNDDNRISNLRDSSELEAHKAYCIAYRNFFGSYPSKTSLGV